MSKSKKQTLLPELRFPEFKRDGKWSEKPLNSYSTRISKKVGTKKFTPISITAGVGFVDQTKKFGRKIAGAQYKNYIHIKRGDFVYNKGNSKTFAQGCIYELKEFNEAAASTAFICFKFDEGYVPGYFQNLFENNEHGKRLQKFITSGARSDGLLNISPVDFFSIQLPIPPSKAEQQKIADCLGSLDELIAAHNAKLTALKDHKKGLLQQLFPAEGQTAPTLRFPEFNNKLNPVDFTALCEIKIGLTHKPNYTVSGIPFLSSKNISSGHIDFKNIKFISEEKFASMPPSTKPKRGDILFTRVGSNLGNPIIFEEDREFGIFVSLGIIRANKGVSNYYIKHWMDSDYFWRQLKQKVAGGAKDNLNTTWLKEFVLSIPPLPEQQKIASFLSSLDSLISAEADTLAALKQHKKGLMQKLFPNPELAKA